MDLTCVLTLLSTRVSLIWKILEFQNSFHSIKDMYPRVSKLGLNFFKVNSGISAGRFKICLINPICVCSELKSK